MLYYDILEYNNFDLFASFLLHIKIEENYIPGWSYANT